MRTLTTLLALALSALVACEGSSDAGDTGDLYSSGGRPDDVSGSSDYQGAPEDEPEPEGAYSGECSDGLDNDKDGLFDGEDPDCSGVSSGDTGDPGADTGSASFGSGGSAGSGGSSAGGGVDTGRIWSSLNTLISEPYTSPAGDGEAWAMWADEAYVRYGDAGAYWDGTEALGWYAMELDAWICYWMYEATSTGPATGCAACDFAFEIQIANGVEHGEGCSETFARYGLSIEDLEGTIRYGYEAGGDNYWTSMGYANTGALWYEADGVWGVMNYNYTVFY